MDFFEHQDDSRRSTKLLVLLFALSVIAITISVYIVVLLTYQVSTYGGLEYLQTGHYRWWHPKVFLYTAGATLLVIGIGSFYMIRRLGAGGEAVAEMLGGRLVDPSTHDSHERALMNVVEEMAIASGTPMPDVYVMDGETSINAFAAGYSISDTVIGVSHGAVTLLSRDQLQGVIAHEFSHILNGDMRLNIKLTGVLHGILCIALIGYWIMRSGSGVRSRARRGGVAQLLIVGVAIWAVGSIGVFFGRLIRSAVSRSREYLADASAVQFTRNPGGIVGALKKIADFTSHAMLTNPNAHAVSHMFFGNALKPSFFNLLSTHPPIADRIKRIDPSAWVDPEEGEISSLSQAAIEGVRQAAAEQAESQQRQTPYGTPMSGFQSTTTIAPAEIHQQVGNPSAQHVQFARDLVTGLPIILTAAARNSFSARAIIYALLLDSESKVRDRQLALLEAASDPLVFRETRRLFAVMDKVPEHGRLPLIDLSIAALRRLSAAEYKAFMNQVEALIKADDRISLHEYILETILRRHLGSRFNSVDRQQVRYRSFVAVKDDVQHLLSVVARGGHTKLEVAQRAFEQGAKRLTRKPMSMLDPSALSLTRFDQAIERLAHASPSLKREIIEATAAVVAADGKVSVREAELLRCVGDALECPIPPILN